MGSIQGKIGLEEGRYAFLIVNRGRDMSEVEIAKGFGFDSPKELYRWLHYADYQICVECGETRVPPDHCDPTPKGRDRKPKTLGDKVELPPATNAIKLFENALDRLHKELETLRGREEYLRGKRFEGVLRDGEQQKALGILAYPPEPLTTLIAVYALVYGGADSPGMRKLLKELHPSKPWEVRERISDVTLKKFKKAKVEPGKGQFTLGRPDPRAVNMSLLDKKTKELRRLAGHVAQIVRGGKPPVGAPEVPLAPRHQAVAKRVIHLHRKGWSDAKIAEDISNIYEGAWFEQPFTETEVRQLIDLLDH